MKRPEWVEAIVAHWGEPIVNVSTPERARVPIADGGVRGRETRYVRMWHWRGPDDAPYGVRLWNTDPNLRHPRIVVEAMGPGGAANHSRPGAQMPLAAIVSVLELAGIPPYDKGTAADLTSRQGVNYARGSTATPDEGEHVSEIENAEATEVENTADAEQAETVETDSAEDNAAATEAGE